MKPLLFLVGALFFSPSLVAEPLRFQYHQGDQYRYLGTSTQRVTLDGVFFVDNLLGYRVAYTVGEVSGESGRLDGQVTYLTQTEGAGAVSHEFQTSHWVDARGWYNIPPNQVMPVVRNVPTFPEVELKAGDTWTGKGEEVHDLSEQTGVRELLRVPFFVNYTYEGTTEREGKLLHVIRSEYSLYKPTGYRLPGVPLYPVLLTGHSTQLHFFNAEKGRTEGYEETYVLTLKRNDGTTVEFSGTGESRLIEALTMDKPTVVKDVKKELEDRGFQGVDVRAAERGVVINLDNIRFPGDSAQLMPSEREKIRLIGEVLAQYPDRDILVEGHTASANSSTDPQALSEARAAAVGDALVALGVRRGDQIVYKGWGSSRPLATNSTEEGRAKNRRVEITLLEN